MAEKEGQVDETQHVCFTSSNGAKTFAKFNSYVKLEDEITREGVVYKKTKETAKGDNDVEAVVYKQVEE